MQGNWQIHFLFFLLAAQYVSTMALIILYLVFKRRCSLGGVASPPNAAVSWVSVGDGCMSDQVCIGVFLNNRAQHFASYTNIKIISTLTL